MLSDYSLFLISQAFSELGDHLWALGLRNYLFENSPWTPAAGLAAIFLVQAIPLFLFGPWLTQSIGRRWRTIALSADAGRLAITLGFAILLLTQGDSITSPVMVFSLLGTQFLLELGTLVFQNCRNCLVPVLYPRPEDITRAHLWANIASLSAAGLVPLFFIAAMPAGGRIDIEWLMTAAFVDAITFTISGAALFALKRSQTLRELEGSAQNIFRAAVSPLELLRQGIATAKKYPNVIRILSFSFLYNLLLMGPVEIGLVTFLRQDLGLPPVALAINLLVFLGGIFAGTFLANAVWKSGHAQHMRRFSYSIFWDGVTFFPICLFALLKNHLPTSSFHLGLILMFFAHYMIVPFVRVSRLAAIQTQASQDDWSSLLGFHAIAVEGAAAVSVIFVAFLMPDQSGNSLLAWGGIGATLCGVAGLYILRQNAVELSPDGTVPESATVSNKGG